ncbi:uncharacterized protein LOC132565111 [Ylistrum balloti]|uniref:uncharacterized protein LOC132565111 n=1 Tax=Ylistrum balloti TaxID=509963 RepID=UPI002905B5BA|nr:uncharacterized protein LOC132565111 [Ylistrum balloti]
MRDSTCLVVFLLIVGFTYLQAAVPKSKRQGMFGLCQGWGAGCSFNYRFQNQIQSKAATKNTASGPRNVRYGVPSYLFTSGNSWNPIGKRLAWFTDIPYLQSPLISRLAFKILTDNPNYVRIYPFIYQTKQDH